MQPNLLDQPADTMTAAVAEYFRSRGPNVRISALELMRVGGALAWRTEVSRCRKAPYCMDIRNETEMVNGKRHSWYRWIP